MCFKAQHRFNRGRQQGLKMQINETAPVVSKHHVTVAAPLQKVWRLLADIDNWPNWNPAVTSAHLDGEFKTGATFRWKSGGVTIVSAIQQIEPMTRLVWTGRAIGTQVVHVWTFTQCDEGVTVSTSESFEGWLVRLMLKTMRRTLDQSLVAWLQALKKCAEC